MTKASTAGVSEAQRSSPATVPFRRRIMPWSSCQVPANFRGKPNEQPDMWAELTGQLLTELHALRKQDPVLAFSYLLVARKVARPKFSLMLTIGLNSDYPVVRAMPDFLKAIVETRSEAVVEHLLAALIHPEFEPSVTSAELFGGLAHRSRRALLERLIALDPGKPEGGRLCPIVNHVILSEPDVDHLIGMVDRTGLWDVLDAAALLDRLIEGQRYTPQLPSLVARLASETGTPRQRDDLLNKVLLFFESLGSSDAIQQGRFRIFEELLSAPFAKTWLEHLIPGADAKGQEEQLLTRVRNDGRRGQALLFMLQWPSIADAVALTRAHHDEMNDIEPQQLREACDQLEAVAPDAALKLYRKSYNIQKPWDVWPWTQEHDRIGVNCKTRPG